MSFRLSKSSRVERILVVSLSNIGDVVLTFPVLDALRAAFPRAGIDVVLGPKAFSLLEGNPAFPRVIAYDKHMPLTATFRWLAALRKTRYDLVVDLRNSMLPFLLNATTVTFPAFNQRPMHMRQKHMARLASVMPDLPGVSARTALIMGGAAERLLQGCNDFVLMAPGAADHRKRWTEDGFKDVLHFLRDKGLNVVFVGDKNDVAITARLTAGQEEGIIDLCGRTSLAQLAGVIARARLALTNDSGIMHLASYLDKPVIALFGPTDPFFYGPWSGDSVVIRKGSSLDMITPQQVIAEVEAMLLRTRQ